MSDDESGRETHDPAVNSEVDTQPVIPLSTEQELQSSCDTYMSQQSDLGEQEDEREGSQEKGQQNTGTEMSELQLEEVNSSLEVETNDSLHNESDILTEREKLDYPQAEGRPEEHTFQESLVEERRQRKRQARPDQSPVAMKKSRQDTPTLETSQDKSSFEVVPESPGEKHRSVGIVEISSTSEKTINLEDSQEFSLRIEDTSPPNSQQSVELAQEGNSWKSHSKEKADTPEHGLSQKGSWSSHQDPSLSWSSHKDTDVKCQTSKNEELLKENPNEELLKESTNEKNESLSPDVVKAKDISRGSESGGKGQQVWDERLLLGSILWTIEDNKVVSGEIKQLSLVEDQGSSEKPGRMSIMSSSSCKTSSSSGSVGLPGPFPLPGYSRLSVMSTVSSSTSSSTGAGCHSYWDGPFLKPPVRDSRPVLLCCHCHTPFAHCDKASSPVVNGGSKLPKIEEVVQKRSTNKKIGGKGPGSSQSQSSGTLLEETSSSDSQPQAASTPTPGKRGRPRKKIMNFIKKEVSTPVKTKIASPGHTPMPARALVLPQSPAAPLASDKGQAVLAKWSGDGRYYPGWAKPTERSTQTLVHFCDGQRKLMSVAWVVRADIITPGTLVLVTVDPTSWEYEEWIVVQVNMEGPEPVFQVERDKDSRDVTFSSIALLEAQVAELTRADTQKAGGALNFNDLSLENIVSHPRKRSSRTTPLKELTSSSVKKKKRQATPEATTSNGQTFGGPDCIYPDTDSSTHSSCSVDLRGRETKPLDVECSPPEVEENSRLKLSHYRRNKSFKSKRRLEEAEPEHLVRMMGPIPEEGCELFADCVFLITYTSEVGQHLTLSTGTPFEDLSDSDGHLPVWKERLRMQIKNGGGKVYQTFSQVAKDELANTYLITDKPCNTPLYLQCLVNNIPIYSTSLIQKCCSQNRRFKELIAVRTTKKLAAGFSLSRQCLVNPRSAQQPLRGKTVLLAISGEQSLSTFWASLIRKMGGICEVFTGHCLVENRFDVIVTDAGCDGQLVAQACEQQVPLVSLTWLQQCIINGDFRSPTEHPSYKYNSSEGQESPEY